MKRVQDTEQGATGGVHRRCPNFRVTGKISGGKVLGVCSKCGEVLERHGKQGAHAPIKGWGSE